MVTTTVEIAKGQREPRLKKLDWLKALSYSQRQRLRFFEAKLLWEGQVNRQDVCKQFGVTANHFTREVSDYRNYYPDNVIYDVSARAYRPTKKFQADFATDQPEEYLSLLQLYTSNPTPALKGELGAPVSCELLNKPEGRVSSNVLRTLLEAIHRHYGCHISYQSFSVATSTKRTIWPHSLAWTGDRWHVRAFDSNRKAYIDLALSRINSVRIEETPKPDEAEEDVDWLEKETVEIIPNPDLSPSQQRVIALEYGMKKKSTGYVWQVTLRRCLIPYFLYRYRLDVNNTVRKRRGFPVQRIIIRDPSIIKKYAFPSNN